MDLTRLLLFSQDRCERLITKSRVALGQVDPLANLTFIKTEEDVPILTDVKME